MLKNDFLALFPHASADVIAANCGEDIPLKSPRKAPLVEQDACPEPLATPHVQEPAKGRFLVRITSVRKRLADEDGLCEKYIVDCCRYAGILRNDDPGTARIETTQRKAEKGEEEHTVVEVWSV